MTWLTRLVAALLVACLSIIVIAGVFDHTVLSSSYIEQKAASTNTYSKLSSSIAVQLAKETGFAGNAQITAEIQQVISPTLLKTKLNTAVDGLVAYYRNNGSAPVIDFTQQFELAKMAGLPLPANSPFAKPITLSGSSQVRSVGNDFGELLTITIILAIVFLGLVLFMSWERHRYAVLPDVAIVTGFIIALVGIAFRVIPSTANHYIDTKATTNTFVSGFHDLVTSLGHSLSTMFLVIGIILLVIGLVFRFTLAKPPKKKKK